MWSKFCDRLQYRTRTIKKLALELVEWARKEIKLRPESAKVLEDLKYKKRYAHSYRQMEIINVKRLQKKLSDERPNGVDSR